MYKLNLVTHAAMFQVIAWGSGLQSGCRGLGTGLLGAGELDQFRLGCGGLRICCCSSDPRPHKHAGLHVY